MRAIDTVRGGGKLEDDRIEMKRSWPGDNKARQLGGAANQARGEYLIYMIGVDEQDGSIHPLGDTDWAAWWAQIESAFDDGVAPELERHVVVHLNETESVVALLFRTDRAPYVVKVVNGGAVEREVPIRVVTGTRSAHRHELIRMLYPVAASPQVDVVEARAAITPAMDHSRAPWTLGVSMLLLFELPVRSSAFLPVHLLRAEVTAAGVTKQSTPHCFVTKDQDSPVVLRKDGIQVDGPGMARLRWSCKFEVDELWRVDEPRSLQLKVEMPVSGSPRPAVASLELSSYSVKPIARTHGETDSFEWTYRQSAW